MTSEAVVSGFGDDAFEHAFPTLFALAMGPALRILRSVPDAEDVAAEVLARVYADWPRLRGAAWVPRRPGLARVGGQCADMRETRCCRRHRRRSAIRILESLMADAERIA